MKNKIIKRTYAIFFVAALLLISFKNNTCAKEPKSKSDFSKKRLLPNLIYNDAGSYLFQEQLLYEPNSIGPYSETWPWLFCPAITEWGKPSMESRCIPLRKYQTVNDFLDARLSGLAKTDIDCISFFDNWIDYKNHPIIGESPLKQLVEWGKEYKKYIFLSVRMNDQHHSVHNVNVFDMTKRKFFMENMNLLIDPISEEEWNSIYLPWTTGQDTLPESYKWKNYGKQINGENAKAKDLRFDWKYKKVRDHFLGEILLKCDKYQLDGVELDFWRTPKMFRDGEEEPEKITEFVRNLKHGLDSIGQKNGKKVFLVIRVPAPSELKSPSLDPEKWLMEKLPDGIIIGQGNYLHESNIDPLREIAQKQGIKVYGPFERMTNRAYYENYGTPDMVRGSAAVNKFKGVDGLYFFNYYIPEEYPVFNTLSNLDKYDAEYCNEVARVFSDGLEQKKQVVTNFTVGAKSKGVTFVFDPIILNDCPGTGNYKIVIATQNIPAHLLSLKINGTSVTDVGEAKYYNNSEKLDHEISLSAVTSLLKNGRNVIELKIAENPYSHPLIFKYLAIKHSVQ